MEIAMPVWAFVILVILAFIGVLAIGAVIYTLTSNKFRD